MMVREQRLLLVGAFALGASMGVSACGDEFVGSEAETPGGAGGAGGGEPALGAAAGVGGAGPISDGGASTAGVAAGAGGSAGGSEPGAGAPGYADDVLSEQPLAYWRMGNTTRGIVVDRSGHGNDLVLQGGGHRLDEPGALRDDDDGAIGFDGTTSFAIASDARVLDFAAGAPFTLECWARRSSGGDSYFQHLLSNVDGVAGDRNGYALYLLPEAEAPESARSVFEYDRPAADLGLWGEVIEESSWGHYVAVFDGQQALFYVNGTLADTKTVSGVFIPRSGPFTVARSSSASGSFFKGTLDEIAIYPRALGVKVVARHFAFGG